MVLIFCVGILTVGVAGDAFARDNNDRIRDLGYITGREAADNDEDNVKYYRNKEKKRVYTTKKLYENDDVIIYRAYDAKGRKYTVTKRK